MRLASQNWDVPVKCQMPDFEDGMKKEVKYP